uniref:Potassium voltage-gated channel subfamily E member 2 n=1 Tax=Gouania willdenowi TaxID=441366 RepID=A0A8C5GGK8_GOUWI
MGVSDWSNLTLRLEQSLTDHFVNFFESWRRNMTHAAAVNALDKTLANENFKNENVIWFLVVMMGLFASIVVAMLVSSVNSKRKEHSKKPYHQYIKEDWTAQIRRRDIVTNHVAQ